MTETELSRAIVAELRSAGHWVIRLQSSGRRGSRTMRTGEPGLPDLYLPGLGHLEVKLPGRELSPAQTSWHARAREAGVNVWTVDSADEALRVTEQWRATKAGADRAA